ncbi:MAG: extracellular solute-binding protein [Spirochaetales bacterium]|jgi:putative aldouronate transport system substrate-binding protein|nr:extracellular solute-binding protein [Spirochaetales bacterium]
MRKGFNIILALFLLLAGTQVFARGGQEEPEAAEGPVKVRWLIPGGAPLHPEEDTVVIDAVNKKMQADGYNLELEVIRIPWDVWQQKTSLMMATGEEFELIHIMEDQTAFSHYVGQGALVPLDEYIDEYGPNLKEKFADWVWDATKVEGNSYVIPAFWAEQCNAVDCFTIRYDWLRENNLSVPKTPSELLDACEIIQKNWSGEGEKPYFIKRTRDNTAFFLHRAYDSFPFSIFQKLIYVDQKGNVKSWVETVEFKKDVDFFREGYIKGLIHPDILGQPAGWIWNRIREGNFLYRSGCPLDLFGEMQANNPGMEEGDVGSPIFNPNGTIMRYYGVKNSNGVSVTSKHPEAGVQFLDWLYSSQENSDLFLYGVEGRHWIDKGPKKIERKRDSDNRTLYGIAEWMIGNVDYIRYQTSTHPRRIELMSEFRDDAVNSIIIGFVFDPSSVEAEYANCLNELEVSVLPMRMGLVSYEDGYANALAKMKAAGIDKVVAEYRKQFSAWLAGRK